MAHNRAERLQGVTERRAVGLTDFECRADGTHLEFKGYASVFHSGYEMYGGPDKGGWIEYIDPRAFERTLGSNPDVVLNINHGDGGTGLPLARTSSKTLDLSTDKKGLLAAATLDLRDPDVQALQVKVERGDVNQMSFAFRTIRQEWDDEETKRTLLEVSLDRGDVSIVTNGANPATSVQLRDWDAALAALTTLDPDDALAEIRSDSGFGYAELLAAQTVLGQLIAQARPADTRATLKVTQAERLIALDA